MVDDKKKMIGEDRSLLREVYRKAQLRSLELKESEVQDLPDKATITIAIVSILLEALGVFALLIASKTEWYVAVLAALFPVILLLLLANATALRTEYIREIEKLKEKYERDV